MTKLQKFRLNFQDVQTVTQLFLKQVLILGLITRYIFSSFSLAESPSGDLQITVSAAHA